MSSENTETRQEEHWLSELTQSIRGLFHLREDTDEPGTVESVRDNVDFKSANAWTLVFAIVIASVGLDTNSTAVIIGAMLISPLMGPIVGTGLGLGINDFPLIKRSLRNLGLAVAISIIASTIYFLVSPLSSVQSELLARTRPTFFDVIIAVFGGAAGIVALSRREKGNAIPGVAIATALMPPLCTAGFGLANGVPKYFFGALYLFVINCVFICISTFVFVRYLKFKKVAYTNKDYQRKIDRAVLAIATVVVIPSLALAWLLQKENSFRNRAEAFISTEMKFEHSFVVGKEVDSNWSSPKITVSLIGESLKSSEIDLVKEKMKRYLLPPDILDIKQASLEESVEKRIDAKLGTQDAKLKQTEFKLAHAELELQRLKSDQELSRRVTEEVRTLFSGVQNVLVFSTEENSTGRRVLVYWAKRADKRARDQLAEFLKQRVDNSSDPILQAVAL